METWIGRPVADLVLELAKRNPRVSVYKTIIYEPFGDPEDADIFDVLPITRKAVLMNQWRPEPNFRERPGKVLGLSSLVEFGETYEEELRRAWNWEGTPMGHLPFVYLEANNSQEEAVEGMKRLGGLVLPGDEGWIVQSTANGYYLCGSTVLSEASWLAFLMKINESSGTELVIPSKYRELLQLPKYSRDWPYTYAVKRYATMRLGTNPEIPEEPKIVGVF